MMDIFWGEKFDGLLKRHPLVLVDVGASSGIEPNWKAAERYLNVIGFEPDNRAYTELMKNPRPGYTYLNTALAEQSKKIKLHLTRKQHVSSAYAPNHSFIKQFPDTGRYEVVGEAYIDAETMDHQFQSKNITLADFVKVDVQGSELAILKGAESTLRKNIFGIEVEVEFAEIYKTQPLFADVDAYLRSLDFQLMDIKRYYWKREHGKNYGGQKGQLIFGDALYFRTVGSFVSMVHDIADPDQKRSKIINAMSICLLYGYCDYAFELLLALKDLFTPDEFKLLHQKLKNHGKMVAVPNFKGRGLVAKYARKFWNAVRPHHDGWAISDEELGNL